MLISSGVESFITNLVKSDSYCESTGVQCSFIVQQSWLNKSINHTNRLLILSFGSTWWHRKTQRLIYASIRTENTTPAAYTLQFEGIQNGATEEEIRQFITKICPEIPKIEIKLIVRDT